MNNISREKSTTAEFSLDACLSVIPNDARLPHSAISMLDSPNKRELLLRDGSLLRKSCRALEIFFARTAFVT